MIDASAKTYMIDAKERARVIERGTGPVVEIADRCAHQFFEEQSAKNPQATALIYGREKPSYGELNARANVIGHFLQQSGIGPESVVGIGMERSVEAVVCILAVFKSGAAYTVVDPGHPAARVGEALSDEGASLLITKSSLKEKFAHAGTRLVEYEPFEARLWTCRCTACAIERGTARR